MASTFGGIEISKRALFAQQTALSTTGHNIANANTAGYSRQVVNLVASRPMEAVGMMRSNVPGQLGQGVEFDHVKRVREQFLDTQYYNENKEYGNWTVRNDVLGKLEAITNEPSDTGIRQVIENFWNAWQVFSKEPENTTARAALKESSLAMTETFNHTASQLDDLTNDLSENVRSKVSETNTILDQVARLNNEIFRVEGLGNDANDLRDQRDLLVDNLSKIINVSVERAEGGYNVKMGNVELVHGINVVTSFAATPVPAADGTIPSADGLTFDAAYKNGDLQSGEVFGMIESRDKYVASYKFQLDSMVVAIAKGNVKVTLPAGSVLPPQLPEGTIIGSTTYTGTETLTDQERMLKTDTEITVKGLNGLHMLGYSLEEPTQSGIPFFTLQKGASEFTASSITLNPAIIENISKITASSRVMTDVNGNIVKDSNGNETVVRGNNSIALITAGIRNLRFDFDPKKNDSQSTLSGVPILASGTFDEFFRAIVGQLGVQTQEATRQSDNQKVLVDQVDSRRQSVSGVATDEEMANMIKYQHAYNAAARILTTFDEMLDKVINGMGTVGR
ncbi:flagellar hook-associated protein FlgK [Paenibacillus thalictri]|uniref:Flagellar hook-associated protein 1 n=1 Tax=Paenibacillus thalictri TaxID=2527873 RepID=A0A4Q9DIB4_9BACL|nr:flagellar hook-associated protein FlgK [Paenibacillus thalictri]TBL72992.1 flagellar hook-associated protein FlgK [Paenibacillus thalictri]